MVSAWLQECRGWDGICMATEVQGLGWYLQECRDWDGICRATGVQGLGWYLQGYRSAGVGMVSAWLQKCRGWDGICRATGVQGLGWYLQGYRRAGARMVYAGLQGYQLMAYIQVWLPDIITVCPQEGSLTVRGDILLTLIYCKPSCIVIYVWTSQCASITGLSRFKTVSNMLNRRQIICIWISFNKDFV